MGLNVIVVSVALNSLLGIYILQRDRRDLTHISFFFLSLVMSLWLIIFYASLIPLSIEINLLLVRLSFLFALLMTYLFFFLAVVMPNKTFVGKKSPHYFFALFSVLVGAISASPFAVAGLYFEDNFPTPIFGPGAIFFGAYVLFVTLATFFVLGKKAFHGNSLEQKRQLQYMLAGFLIMYFLLIITVFIPVVAFKNTYFVSFSPAYALFFLLFTSIAILKYHLFNIRLIATEVAVISLVLFLLFEGLSSGSLGKLVFKLFAAIIVGILGVMVVKNAYRESKQREELAQLAHSLEKANLRLQEIDRQKTEFLSIASHQLRTPLSIIKGYIELIEDGAYGHPTKKMDHVLHDMDDSNEHLVKLVDEFLDITRIEQGRTKYNFAEHDMSDLIDGVVKELKEKADEKKMKIVWTRPKKKGLVTMDDEKIRHVVFNFVDNAIKYSIKGSIKVALAEEDRGIAVRVTDKGLGFGAQDQANFFQKFYRGENVKGTNVNGTGLGIYVCKKFIENHGGKVWAKSPGLGKGSEFGFWIPLKSNPPAPTEEEKAMQAASPKEPTPAQPQEESKLVADAVPAPDKQSLS